MVSKVAGPVSKPSCRVCECFRVVVRLGDDREINLCADDQFGEPRALGKANLAKNITNTLFFKRDV